MSFTLESLQLQLQQRDYKTRNILSAEERLKVIKAYEHMPNYQRLASRFSCSAKQIKNIIANKDSLLQFYDTLHANNSTDEVATRRQEKINFLGKVVYEFLLRALYHRIPISTTIIRQKAYEVKEAIAIENFCPNNAWVQDFKATYNRVDLSEMVERLPYGKTKRQSLKSIDIIEYVSQKEREERRKKVARDKNSNSIQSDESESILSKKNKEKPEQQTDTSIVEATNDGVVYELYSDDEMEEGKQTQRGEQTNATQTSTEQSAISLDSDASRCSFTYNEASCEFFQPNNNATPKPVSLPSFPDIRSYPEALRHLKVLEEFAMIVENYRAIGLITQLEQIFKNPPKLKSITY